MPRPWRVEVGDALQVLRSLPAESVDCCVTSPPYFQLRDYGVEGQYGMEATPQQYVEQMAAVFREVQRVLRPHGTLFCNIADSYAGSGKGPTGHNGIGNHTQRQGFQDHLTLPEGFLPKALMMIPARVAMALQDDGWYLRSQIIWHKVNSMPESVTDRPSKSYEPIFLFSKSRRYYYDAFAVAEEAVGGGTKNKRDVWSMGTQSSGYAHFATFPEELPAVCILAGTSAHGNCPLCGSPWKRIVDRVAHKENDRESAAQRQRNPMGGGAKGVTLGVTQHVERIERGWEAGCQCRNQRATPATVLDPFSGLATTGVVAKKLGRNYLGIELNPDYAHEGWKRLRRTSVGDPVR